MLKNYVINANITNDNPTSLNCKQYDNGIEINLTFVKSEEFISLENYTVTVYFELPNGEVIDKVCDINNNMAKFIIDDDITNLVGKINTEVVLSTIDEEISLNILIINVNKSIRKRG